jgi:hypothetical protein
MSLAPRASLFRLQDPPGQPADEACEPLTNWLGNSLHSNATKFYAASLAARARSTGNAACLFAKSLLAQ